LDLVDIFAPKIAGNYLLDKDRQIIYKLARSNWQSKIFENMQLKRFEFCCDMQLKSFHF